MSPALETLVLVFTGDEGLTVPRRALFIGAEAHPVFAAWPDLTGWQPWKPRAEGWLRAGFSLSDDLPDGKWPLVMVLPGKSRDETLAWFAMARDRLEPGGKIVVAMPNAAGAGRFEKELTRATGKIVSLQKHKCRAFYATEGEHWDEEIFAEWRTLGERRLVQNTRFIVEAGIFSSGHIDPGSQLLADLLPTTLRGEVADLGAGWGFLSDAIKRRCPGVDRLDLFEADARALGCARINLAPHPDAGGRLASPPCFAEEHPEIHFHWHDVAAGLPGKYNAIVMNPPFHDGQATDVALGRAFLTAAASALVRGGKLWMVANRQLPYEATLEAVGFTWRKIAEDKTYKIISAEKR